MPILRYVVSILITNAIVSSIVRILFYRDGVAADWFNYGSASSELALALGLSREAAWAAWVGIVLSMDAIPSPRGSRKRKIKIVLLALLVFFSGR